MSKLLDEVRNTLRERHIPLVLSRREVNEALTALDGQYRLIGNFLYGSGLRLSECLRLRSKLAFLENP